jgi:hypothetical protein
MNEIRQAFLQAARTATELVLQASDDWDRPSALEHMSVGALCGHLLRATGSVEVYLDRPEPETEPVSPAEYYATALSDQEQSGFAPKLDSALHTAIRERSVREAAGGPAEVAERSLAVLAKLTDRLQAEGDDRCVEVFKGICLLLDDYLITRMIELAVHTDDLASSLGLPTPDMPPLVMNLSIETLVDVGRLRHGDIAVLRSLTRRERDDVEALRVL